MVSKTCHVIRGCCVDGFNVDAAPTPDLGAVRRQGAVGRQGLGAITPRPPALKLQEYPKLLQPLKVSADPPISSLVPFLVALRKAGAVDATLGCGASPTERAEAVRLEALFVSWVDRHPWVDIFLGSA